MSRFLRYWVAIWLLLSGPVVAQGFSGLAQVDVTQSRITDTWDGFEIDLKLTQGVPYRAYTLVNPSRLVLDFREVDWRGVSKEALLDGDNASDVRVGAFRPGWSRMVVDLAEPMKLDHVGVSINKETGTARLLLEMVSTSDEEFTRLSGAPYDPEWDLPPAEVLPSLPPSRSGQGLLRVVLDAGHGGIDPGAERDGVVEKDLMLTFAREMKEELLRAGRFEVVMTRDEDAFVSLERRVAIAHQLGAHVFISLHADTLPEGNANGAVVHVLAKTASDEASQKLAERHNRSELLAGVDLTGKDDVVAEVLLDLARNETRPRTIALAQSIVAALKDAGAPINRKPIRSAGFSVLKAADIPSVLLEVGFLSSTRDLKNLKNPNWRATMAAGLRKALQEWMISDAATAELVRQ